MNPHGNTVFTRYLLLILHLALLIFSILFAEERIIHADASCFVFNITNAEYFFISYNRIIGAFSQLLPILGSKLDLSLSAIVRLYSLNIELVFFIPFLLLIWKSRLNLLIAYSIFSIVGRQYSYFMSISELSFGIAFLFILLAFMHEKKWIAYTLTFVLSAFICSAHPLIIFPILVLFIIGIYNFKEHNQRVLLVTSSFLILGFIVCYIFIFSKYEHQSIVNSYLLIKHLGKEFIQQPTLFFETNSNRMYLMHFLNYINWIALTALILVLLIKQKTFKPLILFTVLCLFLCFAAFIRIPHPQKSYAFFEIYNSPFVFLLAAFVWHLMNQYKNKAISIIVVSIITFSFLNIIVIKQYYNKRLNVLTSILFQTETHGCNKALLSFNSHTDAFTKLVLPISHTTCESMLLSNIYDNGNDVFTFLDRPSIDIDSLNEYKDCIFIETFKGSLIPDRFPFSHFKKAYFNLDESPYCTFKPTLDNNFKRKLNRSMQDLNTSIIETP